MDEKEKLHMLMKKDLKEIKTPRKSLMPATDLNAASLDNVIAFLKNPGAGEKGQESGSPTRILNVTYTRLKNARAERGTGSTYWGGLPGNALKRLDSITPAKWGRCGSSGRINSAPGK
jgi:hypothetical protein